MYRPTTHFKERGTSFFRKQEGFSRRCGGTGAMRPQSCDFWCPIFGFIVGGVPGRVFQNCKKIFSCPRHALKPPLICLHVRYRTHELRPLTTKVPFFAVTAKFGGLPGQISKNSFYIFLPPRHALKPPLICLLI